MILEKLTLTDFRAFKGKHSFDLAPRTKYGKKRPIILFGGLNGAGKTTTLMAVRLALYGKQSLGLGTSQKKYSDFLLNSIHKAKDSLIQPGSSSIELTFSYAHLGVIKHYTIKRFWMMNGKRLIEKLSILEDEKELSELNDEQCQGFLNELIPIGVSDLFFFDGEKIADLAEDTTGYLLGDAIKKLLGLDVIETLKADLSILLRNAAKQNTTQETRQEIVALETELSQLESQADAAQNDYENERVKLVEINTNLERLENQLSARGGAWAVTREKEIEKHSFLLAEKEQIQKEIRELFDNEYPLSLAKDFVSNTLRQLREESSQKKKAATAELIDAHLKSLRKNLSSCLDKPSYKKINDALKSEFSGLVNLDSNVQIIHDISDSLLNRIESAIDRANNQAAKHIASLSNKLRDVTDSLEMAGKNIARAPDEAVIKPTLTKINKLHEQRAQIISSQAKFTNIRKKKLYHAIEIARKLKKLTEHLASEEKRDKASAYANGAVGLLREFSEEMAKRKISDLESEFTRSFRQLARKEDVHLRAEIDHRTFAVTLLDDNGFKVDKNSLSAGERQIYAIAILEALARTSGRKLPIIVDTPLARFDSVHRSKVINNYFPYASHQVIILSTDTEVDEELYSSLSNSISHAFKLDFDEKLRSSAAIEGYFWKSNEAEAV
jgi:DNA sulfur modification protein DndD